MQKWTTNMDFKFRWKGVSWIIAGPPNSCDRKSAIFIYSNSSLCSCESPVRRFPGFSGEICHAGSRTNPSSWKYQWQVRPHFVNFFNFYLLFLNSCIFLAVFDDSPSRPLRPLAAGNTPVKLVWVVDHRSRGDSGRHWPRQAEISTSTPFSFLTI